MSSQKKTHGLRIDLLWAMVIVDSTTSFQMSSVIESGLAHFGDYLIPNLREVLLELFPLFRV